MAESSLVQALRNRKPKESESEQLLQMILMQVTKMADALSKPKEESRIVTTQQSHAP